MELAAAFLLGSLSATVPLAVAGILVIRWLLWSLRQQTAEAEAYREAAANATVAARVQELANRRGDCDDDEDDELVGG